MLQIVYFFNIGIVPQFFPLFEKHDHVYHHFGKKRYIKSYISVYLVYVIGVHILEIVFPADCLYFNHIVTLFFSSFFIAFFKKSDEKNGIFIKSL